MRYMQKLFHKFGLNLITPRSEAYNGSKLARDAYRDEFKKKSKGMQPALAAGGAGRSVAPSEMQSDPTAHR